tara:strand:+ start:419 stop:2206 length:1788 start_codon:yes stop_codon:yes gene_type:complete
MGSCIIFKARGENDTATSTNILPNAGTTSSNMDNHNLDGVNSGTGNLSNNSTHNGFTITCGTTIDGHCGKAFNGELESSRDMKVSANDTLVGVTGTESGTTYTATQNKLDGGIILNSYFSVQNCEDGSSSFSCGASSGADDSYVLHLKIKDADGNTLADMTTTRFNDAGYNTNSAKFEDSLTWNGTGGASYEWYWQGFDGSQSSSALRGPNLLGAELLLDFPIDDHEALTTQEIANINEALNTTELTENEIYDIISGLESVIEEEFFATGNLEEGARVELSIEETGLTIEVASTSTGAIMMESPMVQETFSSVMEEMPIETLKEEMVAMVQEEMPFMEIMEEMAPPNQMMEEMEEEEPPMMTMRPGPMMEETSKEEEPPTMRGSPMMMEAPQEEKPMMEEKVASAPTKMVQSTNEKEEKIEEKETAQKEEAVEEKEEEVTVAQKETVKEKAASEKEESVSKTATASAVPTKKKIKQKKVQSKKTQKPKLDRVMAKIDAKVKNPVKNLQLKNLIKMDAMTNEQASLASYNVPFYKEKDIYLNQLNIFDNRQIYPNTSLASYIKTDKVAIKQETLYKLRLKKQRVIKELEMLKNEKS